MILNTYDIKLNHENEEKEFHLRLTVGSQLKLKKLFGEEGIKLIFNAMDDLELMLKLLTEALSFKDNENPVNDGEQFYEILVNNGYCGKEDFARLIFKIAVSSGIIKPEQEEKLSKMIDNTYSSMFDSLTDEKVIETAGSKDDEDKTDGNFRKE